MKWISVLDELPEWYEPVLTCFCGSGSIGVITIRTLVDDGWVNEAGILCPKINVTHWMPLPDYPKDDTQPVRMK